MPATLTVNVKDEATGKPLADAEITVLIGEQKIAVGHTDADEGSFSKGIDPQYVGQTLTCSVTKDGYDPQESTCGVSDGDNVLNIDLSPKDVEKPEPKPPIQPGPDRPKSSFDKRWLIFSGVAVAIITGVVIYILIPKPTPGPIIRNFGAEPSKIEKGQSCTLSWRTENASKVYISGKEKKKTSGSETVKPKKTMSYKLIAQDKEGKEVSSSVTVVVLQPAPPTPANLPDLYVSEFEITPSTPTQRRSVSVRIGVYNKGSEIAKNVKVEWWAGENFPNPEKTWNISTIQAHGGRILNYEYNGYKSWYSKITTKVVIDPEGRVSEGNETNNEKKKVIRVNKIQ